MRTIWITGAGGLIGNYLARSAFQFFPDDRIVSLTRASLELTDSIAVGAEFQRQKPGLIIHCAALTQSPACQADPALARSINVDVTARLVDLAANIPLLFLSTDLVFDGRAGNYDENAAPNPLSVYAETKLEAEKIVLANPRHAVIRTSLNGGVSPTGDRGFNEQIYRAWHAGQHVKLFSDEYRSPICAEVTARAIWELVRQDKPGLYHIAGSERLSRWRIGELLAARHPELNPQIEKSSLTEYKGAHRAPDTSLNCAKVQDFLSFPLPGLTNWLAENPNARF